MEKYLYILRYAVEPGHNEDECIERLLDFCRKALIDDVMFFINCEELNKGHLTLAQTRIWMKSISRYMKQLDENNITTSINPWTTLLHTDRGRVLNKELTFTLMTDPEGRRADAVACPICPEWRKYIAETYSLYASIKPFFLWIEDDFRLHNHAPLKWGGCFCDRHMGEYSKRARKELSREEFVAGILKPGKPNEFRKIWLDVSREAMLENAAIIQKAVHAISPMTKIGLMSSSPRVHCAEARDWHALMKTISRGCDMVVRPHLPSYSEVTPQSYLWSFSAHSKMTKGFLPDGTKIYPELECFPFSVYSKSLSFIRFQLSMSMMLKSDGITMNLFDMMGNGVTDGERYSQMLKKEKKFLSSVKEHIYEAISYRPVEVLCSPDSSYTIQTHNGSDMKELYPGETFFGSLLSCFGIHWEYKTGTDSKESVVAVSGQYFRNLDKKDIHKLFASNYMLLDAEAAYTLHEMDLGELAGIDSVTWHSADDGFASYEQISGAEEYCAIKNARMTSQGSAGDFLEIRYKNSARAISNIKDWHGDTVALGVVEHASRVLIIPYGKFDQSLLAVQANLSVIRREVILRLLKEQKHSSPVLYVEQYPYIHVCAHKSGTRLILMAYNASNDPTDAVSIYLPDVGYEAIGEICQKSGEIMGIQAIYERGFLNISIALEKMSLKVFILYGVV